jgi:hypothetical protein
MPALAVQQKAHLVTDRSNFYRRCQYDDGILWIAGSQTRPINHQKSYPQAGLDLSITKNLIHRPDST